MQAPRQSHQVVQSTLETIVSLDGCQFTVVSLQSSVVKTTGVEGSGGVLCAVHHRGRRQADEPRLLLGMISMHGVPPLAAGGVDRGRSDH